MLFQGKQGGRKGKKKKPLKGITISLDEFSEGGVQGLIDQRKAENRESFTGQHSLNYSPTYQPHSPMQYLIPPPPPPPRRSGALLSDSFFSTTPQPTLSYPPLLTSFLSCGFLQLQAAL